MYSRKGLLVFALILCLFETALSIKCYNCVSKIDGDCYKNPEKYKVDCLNLSGISSDDTTRAIYTAVTNKYRSEGVTEIESDTMCGTYTGVEVGTNSSYVVRMCTNKNNTCKNMQFLILSATNIAVQTCNNCTTDYCNSSRSLQSGAFILGFSLLFTILFSNKL